jgi:hypothetical protein
MLSSISFTSHAKSLKCPFTDNFTINGPAYTQILSVNVQGNLRYTQLSNNFFTLSCGTSNKGDSGEILIDIGMNNNNKCVLAIHDGPYDMNPTVTSINCNGSMLAFAGVEHQWGTYDYTLKFIPLGLK